MSEIATDGPARPQGGRLGNNYELQQQVEARREQVERFDVAGASDRSIAKQLNISRAVAREDIRITRQRRRDALLGGAWDREAEVALELERLEAQRLRVEANTRDWVDGQGRVVYSPTITERMAAERVLVQISRRKAALLGLDQPTQLRITVDPMTALAEGLTDDRLKELTAGLTAEDAGLPVLDAEGWEVPTS